MGETENTDIEAIRSRIFMEIAQERYRQDDKFGDQIGHSDEKWSVILGEEIGEKDRAILEEDIEKLREELIQVAAVAVVWVEALDRRELEAMSRINPR